MGLNAATEKAIAQFEERMATKQKAMLDEALRPLHERNTALIDKMLSGGHREPAATEKGFTFARTVIALAVCKGDPDRALTHAKGRWGTDAMVIKALSTVDLTAGGALVRPEFSMEIIELLRARAVIMSLNPRIIRSEVPISMAKITGGTVAAYIAENQNKPVTQLETGEVTLNPKELAALCPISNKLLRATDGNAEEIVRDDLVAAVGLRSDLAFIRGDGLQNTPVGLRNWAPAANVIPATQAGGTASLAEVSADVSKLVIALAAANVMMARPGWIWAPRTTEFLRNLRDGNGNLVYMAELNAGTFRGWPYRETTQVPTTLGGGGNESEVYLADFNDVIVAEAPQLLIDASGDASYTDAAGTTHSAFQKNQTVVRISTANDLVMRHNASVAVLTAVKWGA